MKKLIEYKKRLLKNQTRAERRFSQLLNRLKGLETSLAGTSCSLEDMKIEKQRIFYNRKKKKGYIVDFYLPRFKLVFEIDGKHHKKENVMFYDETRNLYLAQRGIQVVRIENKETHAKNIRQLERKILDLLTRRASIIEKRKGIIKGKTYPRLLPITEEAIAEERRQIEEYISEYGVTKCPTVRYYRKPLRQKRAKSHAYRKLNG